MVGLAALSVARRPDPILLQRQSGVFDRWTFDERNLIELTSEQFPGERLVVCRNPLLAQERARKRI